MTNNTLRIDELAEKMNFPKNETEAIIKGRGQFRNYNSLYLRGTNVELTQELLKQPEDMSPEQKAKVLGGIEDNTDNIPQHTSSTEDAEYTRPKDAEFTLDEEF